MRKSAAAALLVLWLGACASTPKLDFYTLDMTPSGRARTDVNVVVERFRVSELLDRNQILIQHSATGIDFYANGRWAAGIGELVQHKLRAELGPVREGRRTVVVSGEVVACQQVDVGSGAEARLRLAVVIREDGSRRFEVPLLEKVYEAVRAADAANADAVVRALSRAAEEIAVEIAADASALPAPEISD